MRGHRAATGTAAVLLVITGCGGPTSDTTGSATPSATSDSTPSANSTDLGSPPAMTTPIPVTPLYQPGDIDSALQLYTDTAKADLAELLGVDPSEVSTRAAVLVVWPDRSLGCPTKDMRYPQVPTDGSIIELEHAGRVYRYHAGGARGPFQCATPQAKAPTRIGPAPSTQG